LGSWVLDFYILKEFLEISFKFKEYFRRFGNKISDEFSGIFKNFQAFWEFLGIF
jgi:hypothetical protein